MVEACRFFLLFCFCFVCFVFPLKAGYLHGFDSHKLVGQPGARWFLKNLRAPPPPITKWLLPKWFASSRWLHGHLEHLLGGSMPRHFKACAVRDGQSQVKMRPIHTAWEVRTLTELLSLSHWTHFLKKSGKRKWQHSHLHFRDFQQDCKTEFPVVTLPVPVQLMLDQGPVVRNHQDLWNSPITAQVPWGRSNHILLVIAEPCKCSLIEFFIVPIQVQSNSKLRRPARKFSQPRGSSFLPEPQEFLVLEFTVSCKVTDCHQRVNLVLIKSHLLHDVPCLCRVNTPIMVFIWLVEVTVQLRNPARNRMPKWQWYNPCDPFQLYYTISYAAQLPNCWSLFPVYCQ